MPDDRPLRIEAHIANRQPDVALGGRSSTAPGDDLEHEKGERAGDEKAVADVAPSCRCAIMADARGENTREYSRLVANSSGKSEGSDLPARKSLLKELQEAAELEPEPDDELLIDKYHCVPLPSFEFSDLVDKVTALTAEASRLKEESYSARQKLAEMEGDVSRLSTAVRSLTAKMEKEKEAQIYLETLIRKWREYGEEISLQPLEISSETLRSAGKEDEEVPEYS